MFLFIHLFTNKISKDIIKQKFHPIYQSITSSTSSIVANSSPQLSHLVRTISRQYIQPLSPSWLARLWCCTNYICTLSFHRFRWVLVCMLLQGRFLIPFTLSHKRPLIFSLLIAWFFTIPMGKLPCRLLLFLY